MNADLLWRSQVYKLMCVLIIKDIVASYPAQLTDYSLLC